MPEGCKIGDKSLGEKTATRYLCQNNQELIPENKNSRSKILKLSQISSPGEASTENLFLHWTIMNDKKRFFVVLYSVVTSKIFHNVIIFSGKIYNLRIQAKQIF